MRIIAGKWRGRHIEAVDTDATRPILDRAKTVLFDVLGHLLAEPGRLPPVAVLDLFCGTGTLGIEALSRGGRYCLFVEQARQTAALLRTNLDTLQVIREARVIQADASSCALPPPPAQDDPRALGTYGLVFVDPPYRLLKDSVMSASMRRLFERLATDAVIASDAVIVVRHDAKATPNLSPLVEWQNRQVGSMILRLMRRPDAPAPTATEEPPCPVE